MSAIESYLDELERALRVRGAARRRFLRECREHLADAAAERGATRALRDFGPPAEIAAAFDTEVATHRSLRATLASVAGVVTTGGSTLALIHAAAPGSAAPSAWAIMFFVAAQVAAVALGLALLQALVHRRAAMSPVDAVLLARRNGCALLAAGATMSAAAGALPGRGSALVLIPGPVLLAVAGVGVLRAWRLGRRLDATAAPAVRPPTADLHRLLGPRVPLVATGRLLPLATGLATAGAFLRDRGEHATMGQALGTAGIEAGAVVGCFLLLGPALGLWHARGRRSPGAME